MAHKLTPEEQETLETYNRMSRLWNGVRYDRPRDQIRGRFYSLVPRGGKVLDLGCGTGKDTPLIVAEGLRYVGIDLSQGMLGIAVRDREEPISAGRASFFQMSTYELSFVEGSFSAVVAFALFQHIPRQSVGKVLAEIKRVLKPEGRALVTVAIGEGEIMFRSKKHNCGRILIVRWRSHDFIKVVKQVGLNILSCKELINASSSDELGSMAILNLQKEK